MRPRSSQLDDLQWHQRIERDARRAPGLVPGYLQTVHNAVSGRARNSGAVGLLLTGSTARGTRTEISDLDYHLVGEPIDTADLPEELDIHVVSAAKLRERLEDGDDFTHWSLRFGLVVFDDGVIRDAANEIVQRRLWPDPARKREQAEKSLRIAQAMVDSGDQDAAIEQVRTALTLTARWGLLEHREFPLSRGELPAQLRALGADELAAALAKTICGAPALPQLARAVRSATELLASAAQDRALAGR